MDSPDVHFEPIVKLAPVEVKTLEENEEEVFRMQVHMPHPRALSEMNDTGANSPVSMLTLTFLPLTKLIWTRNHTLHSVVWHVVFLRTWGQYLVVRAATPTSS